LETSAMGTFSARRARALRLWAACLLALAGLVGCESIADLDELHVVRDADVEDSESPDAGEPYPEDDAFAELRALCLDTINAHRATLELAPLARASAGQERCADEGAQTDAELDTPHYAAQNRSAACKRSGLSAENTCPNWRFGPGSERADAAAALVSCIQRMWDQGAPPVSEGECRADLAAGGCFAQHGEWLNLTSTRHHFVACGFAAQGDDAIWINQDFAVR
jgi:hypothetical protein